MMRKYRICALLLFLLTIAIQTAYAADTATTTTATVPWDSALEKMVNVIQVTARPVVSIMIAVTGLMVMFGSGEGQLSTLFRIILGLGIVLQVADLINGNNSMFETLRNIAAGNVVKPTPPVLTFNGPDKGINFIGLFMTYYENICIYGASILAPYALKVLAFLTIIEMTMTLMFKLEGDHIKYLLHQIIKVGFFIFLIQNWIGGTGSLLNIANTIFTSFEQLGILAAGAEEMKPENVLVNAFQVITTVSNTMDSAANGSMLIQIFGGVIALIVFICIALTAIQLVLTRLEFWTIAMIIVPLIPFGAYTHTRFLFEKAIGAIFNLGIKMGIVSFVCIVAGPLINGMVSQMDSGWSLSAMGSNFVLLLQIFVGTLLLAVLSWKIPSMAAGLLNGQPSLSGGDLLAPAKSVANAGKTAVSLAYTGGAGTALSGKAAASGAGATGGSLKNLAMMSKSQGNTQSGNNSSNGIKSYQTMKNQQTANERTSTEKANMSNKSSGADLSTYKWMHTNGNGETASQKNQEQNNLKDANIKNKK